MKILIFLRVRYKLKCLLSTFSMPSKIGTKIRYKPAVSHGKRLISIRPPLPGPKGDIMRARGAAPPQQRQQSRGFGGSSSVPPPRAGMPSNAPVQLLVSLFGTKQRRGATLLVALGLFVALGLLLTVTVRIPTPVCHRRRASSSASIYIYIYMYIFPSSSLCRFTSTGCTSPGRAPGQRRLTRATRRRPPRISGATAVCPTGGSRRTRSTNRARRGHCSPRFDMMCHIRSGSLNN